ncbi:MAG: M48 family metallopeptidase [Candidatus Diapherotrites archaeon]|nr:M48 family metallopeptidase [Candidatus Diapherotrites archaeon]
MMMINDFKKEVNDWAGEVGVTPKEIHVRQMRKKWASCSSKGRLSFSYELLEKPYEERSTAIVHELLHLRYSKHNKLFNAVLDSYLIKKGIDYTKVKL